MLVLKLAWYRLMLFALSGPNLGWSPSFVPLATSLLFVHVIQLLLALLAFSASF